MLNSKIKGSITILSLCILAISVLACKKGETNSTLNPAGTEKSSFISNPKLANALNELQAYGNDSQKKVSHYVYGSFDTEGNPKQIKECTLVDSTSGIHLNTLFDDSLNIKLFYFSKGVFRDTTFFRLKQTSLTTVRLTAYAIDWSSNFTRLRSVVDLEKSGDTYKILSTQVLTASGRLAAQEKFIPNTSSLNKKLSIYGQNISLENFNIKNVNDWIDNLANGLVTSVAVGLLTKVVPVLAVVVAAAVFGPEATLAAAVIGAFLYYIIKPAKADNEIIPNRPVNTPISPSNQIKGSQLDKLAFYENTSTTVSSSFRFVLPDPNPLSSCLNYIDFSNPIFDIKVSENGQIIGLDGFTTYNLYTNGSCVNNQRGISAVVFKSKNIKVSGQLITADLTMSDKPLRNMENGFNASFSGNISNKTIIGTLQINNGTSRQASTVLKMSTWN